MTQNAIESKPAQAPMPEFRRPPVAEVVCGLTFKPLQMLLVPHIGLLWSKFRADYPSCKEVDALVPVVESFKEEDEQQMNFSLPALPRVWFISKDNNGIIQVQRDRYLQNWRKVRTTDEYPRYATVKSDFKQNIGRFQTFLNENELGTIQLEQLELTYINHIYQGEGWDDVGKLAKVFPDFAWRADKLFLTEPERINWRTSFVLPDQAGRMHVTIQNAMRRNDKKPLILFELTVRGIGHERAIENIWGWFDLAREWIVRGFADLTGPDMHKSVWLRTK
jgi:uncharacterized protein (TIGR04255 family)